MNPMPKQIGLVLLFLVFLFALFSGMAGVDFGSQWDQNFVKGQVNKYVRTGNLLAGSYYYPPVSSYIATSTTLPYAAPFVARYGTNWVPTQNYLLNEVLKNPNQAFLLNLRRVFVFFTTLAVLWVGLAAGQRNWLAGVVAGAVLAFSWEVNYHSRYVLPDGPTMQFVALSLSFCLFAFYKVKPLPPAAWLYLAAAASSAATATKYTAGLSLLAVLFFGLILWKQDVKPVSNLLLRWVAVLLVFALVFLLLVPGVLLEPDIFWGHVIEESQHYAYGHGRQTVDQGWDHLSRMLIYLFAVAFSPYPILATTVGAFILLGIYALLRSPDRAERWLGAVLVGVPALYLLFLATHRVLFVRNLLQVLPSLALFAGFGFQWLYESLGQAPQKRLRFIPVALLALVLGFNAHWILSSVQTIRARDTDTFIHQALNHIAAHPEQSVYMTAAASQLLAGYDLPAHLTADKSGSQDLVLFAYLADAFDEEEGNWPVNEIGASPLIFGPREINMDWYASWPSVERLVLAAPGVAWEAGRSFTGHAAAPEALPLQTYTGLLTIDGQQFMLENEGQPPLFIMNSAHPQVVLSLRSLLDTQVSLSARPYNQWRLEDVFLSAVNGLSLLDEESLQTEYNFSRFSLNRSEAELQCVRSALGEANYRTLLDHAYGFMEFPDEQLAQTAQCLQ
ncbi:MAG: hypothetical protein KIS73_02325 [Enhydrobacter sp.]|nr:hypothetical protein [Enhydrobacter sp.]